VGAKRGHTLEYLFKPEEKEEVKINRVVQGGGGKERKLEEKKRAKQQNDREGLLGGASQSNEHTIRRGAEVSKYRFTA